MQRVSRLASLSPTKLLSSISQVSQVPPGSIRGSTFTLLTAIVGAGILSLPYAFRQAGLLCGLVAVVLFAAVSWFSIHLLIESTSACGEMSYQGLGDFCGGRRLRVFTQTCLLLNLYGTTVAYTIASGKLLSSAIRAVYADDSVYTSPKAIACGCFLFATLPLSSMRQVSSLRYSSLLAVVCSCYLAVVLVAEYVMKCQRGDIIPFSEGVSKANLLPTSASQFFRALPIVVYAYTCHPNVLPIYLELQRPSTRRIHRVLRVSTLTAMILYLVVATAGYLTFLDDTQGNILQLAGYHNATLVLVAVVAMELAIVSAIPLFIHAFRSNAEAGFFRGRPFSSARHIALTVLPLGGALIVALCVNELTSVFSFLGATTNPVICYLLPAYFFLCTHRRQEGADTPLDDSLLWSASGAEEEKGPSSPEPAAEGAVASPLKRGAAGATGVVMVALSVASLLAQFGVF